MRGTWGAVDVNHTLPLGVRRVLAAGGQGIGQGRTATSAQKEGPRAFTDVGDAPLVATPLSDGLEARANVVAFQIQGVVNVSTQRRRSRVVSVT